MLRVGSLAAGVFGSSDGRSAKPVPLTKPWFEMTVPLTALGLTVTSKVMVATLAGLLDASAGIMPGMALPGGLIAKPFASGDNPPVSATTTPFSFVLPGE